MNDRKIKLFIMDVDGTLTDGKVYIGTNGELMKAFSIKDGYGIRNILIPAGIKPIIITGRKSDIVKHRCDELGITDVFQNVGDKLTVMSQVCQKNNVSFSNVAYIGDDENDLPCMLKICEESGIVGCPYDAVDSVKKTSSYVCKKSGGDGAVREFINFIID